LASGKPQARGHFREVDTHLSGWHIEARGIDALQPCDYTFTRSRIDCTVDETFVGDHRNQYDWRPSERQDKDKRPLTEQMRRSPLYEIQLIPHVGLPAILISWRKPRHTLNRLPSG
jgi:hypothetical protein